MEFENWLIIVVKILNIIIMMIMIYFTNQST